jgi:hypothetical protein
MRSTLQDGFRNVGFALGVVQGARRKKINKVAQSLRDNRGPIDGNLAASCDLAPPVMPRKTGT